MADRSSRANPDVGDARIPCPACAQPIHPVAGRCKHCKTDLVKLREQHGRRAARLDPGVLAAATQAAPPPSPFAPPAPSPYAPPAPSPFAPPAPSPYAPPAAPSPPASPYAPPGLGAPAPAAAAPPANGHALPVPAPLAAPPPLPAALAAGAPDATPYPGVVDAAAASAEQGLARRWPLVVAILAGVAIIVCVILLFSDDNKADAGRSSRGRPAPAPDRMDTSPSVPRPDPWAPRGAVPAVPDPADPFGDSFGLAPDDDDDDLYGQLVIPDLAPPPPPSPPRGSPAPAGADDFTARWTDALCQRMSRCGVLDGLGLDPCALIRSLGLGDEHRQAVRQGRCTYDARKADRCLQAIDAIPCPTAGSGGLDGQLLLGLMELPACMDALQCR